MADNKEALRALKIKTGVMTRVRKELAMYEQEVKTETEKLEAMKAEGRDPHDVKQQDQVLGESTMMIGDCKSRMESAFNDLLAASFIWAPRRRVSHEFQKRSVGIWRRALAKTTP